jgi:hypothetical protein
MAAHARKHAVRTGLFIGDLSLATQNVAGGRFDQTLARVRYVLIAKLKQYKHGLAR